MKIGIFDSGIGGLSVLHLAMKKLQGVHFIYYADKRNVPYGEKSKEQIVELVDQVMQFYIRHQVDAVVLACNTATSASAHEMRKVYDLPIIGMEPAVKKAVELYDEKKVLVAATPITVKGDKMNRLLERVDKDNRVDLVALPGLVSFAEQEEFDSPKVIDYLQRELGFFSLEEYSAFVLGCTHFNYFKNSFRHLLPAAVSLLDGNEGTVNHLASQIEAGLDNRIGENFVDYYFSGELVTRQKELSQISRYMERLERMISIQ